MSAPEAAFAVDIGGTNLRVAVIGRGGVLEGPVVRRRVPFGLGGVADLEGILSLIEPHLAAARDAASGPLPVGISLCGNVDAATGASTLNANLGWRNVPFGQRATERLGVQVGVLTDVRAAALAEAAWGAGRGVADFMWVTLGTGYGAYLVLDGRIYGGAHGDAGNLGHASVGLGSALPCGCGGRGCVETLVAGPAIARAGDAAIISHPTTLLRHPANGGPMTASLVFDAYLADDPAAREIVGDVVEALALSLRQAVDLLDLSLIIFGGGVIRAAPWLLGLIDDRLRPQLMTAEARQDLRFAMESFEDSALWGAAAHAFGLQPEAGPRA